MPRPGRKLVFGCARWPGNKKPPRWAVVCGQWAQALERVHAVFAQGRFLGEQADHFFRRTRLWLWSGFVLFGLELHNGVEESHGFSFRVVEGAAFLSNGLCRSMVDYDCENFVKPMNFYEVIRFAEMCRCACWCSSQTQTPCGQGAWVFPLLSCRGQRRWCGGLCCSWQPGLPHPLTVYALWRLDTAGMPRRAAAVPADAMEPGDAPRRWSKRHGHAIFERPGLTRSIPMAPIASAICCIPEASSRWRWWLRPLVVPLGQSSDCCDGWI